MECSWWTKKYLIMIYTYILNKNLNWNFHHVFIIATKYKANTDQILSLQHKLDGVGPVDNRASTDKLHHFVRKKKTKKRKKMTCDMWHVTHDIWHVTHDTWHVVTRETWHVWGVNILSKFQLPSSYRLWFMILWRSGEKGWLTEWMNESINQSMTRLFIEQPRLHRVC